MIRLKVEKINNCLYDLKDERENKYELNLEFLDMEKNLNEGDYISISAELLNEKYEGYSTFYTFGSMDSQYGKKNISFFDIDVIKLETDSKEIYLKRLYG